MSSLKSNYWTQYWTFNIRPKYYADCPSEKCSLYMVLKPIAEELPDYMFTTQNVMSECYAIINQMRMNNVWCQALGKCIVCIQPLSQIT